ncbi:MAG: murein hydrolase activator EnvC family protein [Gaiellales bacterium]
MPGSRKIITLALAALAVAAGVPAALAGGGLIDRKTEVDQQLEGLRGEVRDAKQRARVLTSDLQAANQQIDVVESVLDEEGRKLERLESDLARRTERLETLRARFGRQSEVLDLQVAASRRANEVLEERLVEIYKTGGTDILTAILLNIDDLGALIDQATYVRGIAQRDTQIVDDVRVARRESRQARERTRALRSNVAQLTRELASATQAQRRARDSIAGRESELVDARADRRELLVDVRSDISQTREEISELEVASAALQRRIIVAQSRSSFPASVGTGPRPASGFIWPVNGVLTSGFGFRWGRLHAGIDIGVGFGTPIAAAAAGVVIQAGWLGGYGNLVVVDHGRGLSTAYAHQQRIIVTVGQSVSQGQQLGEVGSTGFSTGAHLHFEVRVNGVARDPLGYL